MLGDSKICLWLAAGSPAGSTLPHSSNSVKRLPDFGFFFAGCFSSSELSEESSLLELSLAGAGLFFPGHACVATGLGEGFLGTTLSQGEKKYT